MENKRTLHDYLYENIKSQIEDGYLKYGDTLPSIKDMHNIYNVGVRTVREVIKELSFNGYIQTHERKLSVVSYRLENKDKNDLSVSSLIKRRDTILDVYTAMEIIMPSIFYFCSGFCDSETFLNHKKLCRQLGKKNPSDLWPSSSKILHDILNKSGNPLFSDVYSSFESYTQIPVHHSYVHPFIKISERFDTKRFFWVLSSLKRSNFNEVHHRFKTMYIYLKNGVRQYLDTLSADFPDIKAKEPFDYQLNSEASLTHFYKKIQLDIISNIEREEFADGELIPSSKKLAEHYNVSLSTVRRALYMLNEIGICHTVNGVGTYVTKPDSTSVIRCTQNKTYRKDIFSFLYAYQFMTVAIYPASAYTFKHIKKEDIEALADKIKSNTGFAISYILECVMERLPNKTLKLVFNEINNMLWVGNYLSFFQRGKSRIILEQKGISAMHYLTVGDCENFSKELSDSFGAILESIRDFIISCGMKDAEKVIVPKIYK